MNLWQRICAFFKPSTYPIPSVVIPKAPTSSLDRKLAIVRPLLVLIGKTEGTAKADGYNETLSYGAYTGGDVHLVGMTLDYIDILQTKMLLHPQNKWNSSAVGMYQIIRTTLRTLRKNLKLTGRELFDGPMQDRLALALLEGRGLDKWLAGRMSTNQFIDQLSAEWASLPNAKGNPTYAGQGVGTSTGSLTFTLAEVRSLYNAA